MCNGGFLVRMCDRACDGSLGALYSISSYRHKPHKNFIVQSLFNYVWFVCFHLYYLCLCISLYTCANVICIKLLLTYLLTYMFCQSISCSFHLFSLSKSFMQRLPLLGPDTIISMYTTSTDNLHDPSLICLAWWMPKHSKLKMSTGRSLCKDNGEPFTCLIISSESMHTSNLM